MLVIKQKSKHIVHGRGCVKCEKKYIKGRGFVDVLNMISKIASPIASATTSAVTIGKNTYDVVNAIRNRNKKPELAQSAEDNLLNALKSGKGFQYV